VTFDNSLVQMGWSLGSSFAPCGGSQCVGLIVLTGPGEWRTVAAAFLFERKRSQNIYIMSQIQILGNTITGRVCYS
jgi:hypothetical protein